MLSYFNIELLEWGRVTVLWHMLNVLCTLRYTGAMSDNTKEERKNQAHLALKIFAIITVLSTV